jgi:osmotically-inducible protein OsmY
MPLTSANGPGVSASPDNVSRCRHDRFPHPVPLPKGEGEAERAARDFRRHGRPSHLKAVCGRGVRGSVLLAAAAAACLQGCVPVALTGAAVGASVIHDRRTTGTVLDDQQIELKGAELLHNHPEISGHSHIDVTSYNLVALLTGQAETQEISDRFAQLVARLPKVKRVMNEVTVGPVEGFAQESEDALTTSRVKLALFGVKLPEFDPSRVKVVTAAGTVYLMGLVTPAEAEAAVEKARYVPGVKRVVKIFEYIPPPATNPA